MQGEIFKVLDQSLPPQQLPTTTDLLKIRINTGSGLAHARETTREKQRTERQWRAKSAGMGRVPLARQIREVPPELALRADVKKPETGSGFWNWWWKPEPNPSPISEQESVRQTTVRILPHSAIRWTSAGTDGLAGSRCSMRVNGSQSPPETPGRIATIIDNAFALTWQG